MATATTLTPARSGPSAPIFPLTTNPGDFWDGAAYRETLLTLRRAVQEKRGVVLLTGDVGCGKTMLVNVLAESLRREGAIVGVLPHPQVDALELLQAIAGGLGLTTPFDTPAAFAFTLRDFIAGARAAGRPVLFIVDEAQGLPREALAEIARLPLGGRDGAHGLTVLLAGQEALHEILAEEEHAALARAIEVTCRLGPLTESEVAEYVRYQLRRAGVETPGFEAAALHEIAEASRGNPRLVNTLSGVAFALARREGLTIIRAKLVRQCAVDLTAVPRPDQVEAPPRRRAPDPSRSGSSAPRRYALALITAAGATSIAAAAFAVTVYVLTRPTTGVGRPASASVAVQPERAPRPPEPRQSAAPGDVPPVNPGAQASSAEAPSVASPDPPRTQQVTPTVSTAPPVAPTPPAAARTRSPLPRPAEPRRAEAVAKTVVRPSTPPRRQTEEPTIAPPREVAPTPAPPGRTVTARPETPSSEPDPAAIIDWVLTKAPGRRTALPESVSADR